MTGEALPLTARQSPARVVRAVLTRVGFYVAVLVLATFFALPMLWLVTAPFDRQPGLGVAVPSFTLQNFVEVFENPFALPSLVNSVILSVGTMVLVVTSAALSAYALSRVSVPGRDLLLYVLLLFSAIVTGTAAMVPLFQLVFQMGLINTFTGVVLVLAGGLLPAGIFILKDFMDTMPRSYEESALVAGAGPLQTLRDVVVPVVRPGLAVIAVWTVVNVWGDFLIPFILLRSPEKAPAAVRMFSFYTEGGQANLSQISAFSFLYSLAVVIMYLVVNRRYGFRFHGGIKG
ncbi:MAG: carbohydrate ABC transporter permease [Actinomycetota bacterium]|nr:carbohydrate ABC transporter permease [Actinomycetota bacterium]